ncbi:MAG: DsbA family protein [Halocynthiibacter sp.]
MTKILAAIAAVIVLAGGAYFLMKPNAPAPVVEVMSADTTMSADMMMGSEDAPIEFIEYASFTCPHCATFHESVVKNLKKDYVDTGKVKFIFREVYFDRYGLWAGIIAQCGGENRYFSIVDRIMATQKDWTSASDPNAIVGNLKRIAIAAGVSEEALDACLADEAKAEEMLATYQKNAALHNIDATPQMVINGKKYSNMSYEQLRGVLDGLLAQ